MLINAGLDLGQPPRRRLVAANTELQEREALKGARIAAAIATALAARDPQTTAWLAAHIAALSMKATYERWSESSAGEDFAAIARRVPAEAQTAGATLH